MSLEQATATVPDKTVWVGASAGTGKTHILTARVLRLMVGGTPPGNIICLTFTKAAAAEMKTRIFKELGAWAVMDDIALIEALSERVDERATTEMIDRARRLFAQVLDLPGGLQIMTFHSFCQSLLGRFPLEAGLAPGFEALDDQLAATVKLEARDSVLKSALHPKALRTVAQRVTEDDFDRVMESLMFRGLDVKAILDAYGATGLRAVMCRHFGLTSEATKKSIIDAALSPDQVDLDAIRAVFRVFNAGSKNERKYAALMQPLLEAEDSKSPQYFEDYCKGFLTQKDTPYANMPTKGTIKKNPEVEHIYHQEQQRLYDVRQNTLKIEMIDATTALLQLGFQQMQAYQNLKHARGLVDFDDMINGTVSLLSEAAAAPWILYKMDGGIDHILVDEAQDTNAHQWQVVESLTSEFFAGSGARAGENTGQSDQDQTQRTVFAVGDVKQSIYSFQKADPKEFVAARGRIFSRAEGARADFQSVPLNRSYRSGGAVLGLVDQVFRKGGPAYEGLTFDGEDIRHDFHRQGLAGSVELWPLVTEEDADQGGSNLDPQDQGDIWQAPVVQEEKRDAERQTAWMVARHIADQIKEEKPLSARGRPVTAGDIMVIVRKRSGFVEQLTRALKILGIPVSGRDRMQLASELPVMDILSLIRFVLQPGDDLSCAEVLTGPFAGLSHEALFDLAHGRKGSLWHEIVARHQDTALTDQLKIQGAYDFLSFCLTLADRGTPFDFIMAVLNQLDGRKKLIARLGDDVEDALDELLEEALNFERVNSPSLQGFYHSFELSDVTIKRDMEAAGNAVRIMTAHGSKGLQAPIVYLPDTTSVPETGRDTAILSAPSDGDKPDFLLWTSGIKNLALLDELKEQHKTQMLAEYRRLLYVAMTRAEDHLYIVGWQKKRKISDDCWYKLIEHGFEQWDQAIKLDTAAGQGWAYQVDQTKQVTAPPVKPLVRQADKVPAYFYQPAPEEPTPSKPIVPSRPEGEEPAGRSPLSRAKDTPYQRGNIIHTLLEWLPSLPLDRRDQALQHYLAMPGHGLSADRQQALADEVMAVLTHEKFAALFGPDSRAEVPIAGLLSDGQAISGQVDRLVIRGDLVQIVDYKTNQPAPKVAEDIPAQYRRQMALYRRALGDIYPDKQIKTYLLWTDILTLMEVIDP